MMKVTKLSLIVYDVVDEDGTISRVDFDSDSWCCNPDCYKPQREATDECPHIKAVLNYDVAEYFATQAVQP